MHTYSLRDIESMLGVSRAVIAGLVASGFVTPTRGPRREYRFGFQDIVLLRTAHRLQSAHVPPRKIVRALQRLKATLPQELPLTGLRITAVGSEVAVREGATQWHVDSGQLLMDFELVPAPGATVAVLPHEPEAGETAADCFARAMALEAGDPAGAERAYRRAIAAAPRFVDPYLNLGVMLCEHGRCDEAVDLYRQAVAHAADQPLLHFNLAIALEDARRNEEALAAYEACLALDPDFADAHYNAARLHELLGHPKQAIRHYSAYRRLQK